MTTEPDPTSSAPMAPTARAWWKPRPPRPGAAFTGPMTGARLNALVGLALWTLFALAIAAVVVAASATCAGVAVRDSWAWEVYKTLAQLVVAALGVGFAFAFPLRLQAVKAFGELRAKTLAALARAREAAGFDAPDAETTRAAFTECADCAHRLREIGAAPHLVARVNDLAFSLLAVQDRADKLRSADMAVLDRRSQPRSPELAERLKGFRDFQLEVRKTVIDVEIEVVSYPGP